MTSKQGDQGHRSRRRILATAVAAAGVLSGTAQAVQFDTGNSPLSVRWDNTFKYSAMVRVASQDEAIITAGPLPIYDDSTLNFKDNDLVLNRFDLLSELDVVWDDRIGVRITGAGWYDFAFADDGDHPGFNRYTNSDTWGHTSVPPGEYTQAAKDIAFKGGELLDAFAFANFNFGDVGASVRAGRHALYWGQSLFVGGAVHGIAGSMAPLDLAKGFGIPGAEAKELFLPSNKLSASLQLNQNTTLVGYYSFEFEEVRYPDPGTYLALSEISTDDSEFLTLIPGAVDPSTGTQLTPRLGYVNTGSRRPTDGEYGLGAQFYFSDSDVELGVYYLNYHDKYPQGLIGALDYSQFYTANLGAELPAILGGAGLPPQLIAGLSPLFFGAVGSAFAQNGVPFNVATPGTDGRNAYVPVGKYKWTYREDNELFGISLNKEIAGISFGADLVYRKDVAINFGGGTLLRTQNYNALTPALVPGLAGQLTAALTPVLGPAAGPTAAQLALIPLGVQQAVDAGLAGFGFNLAAPSFDYTAASESNYAVATGDTAHLVLNGLGFLSPSRYWDGGSWAFEITAATLLDYGQNPQFSEPRIDKEDLELTGTISFTPQWYQVRPGLDVRVPFTLSYGFLGEGALSTSGNEGIGNGVIGATFEYQQRWLFDVRYNYYFGDQDGGPIGNIRDRDNLTFAVKRTF